MALETHNLDVVLLESAARTATTNSDDQLNVKGKGVKVFFDVTAVSGTPSLTLKIQGKDPVSGKYVDLLESAAVSATGTNQYTVYPGIGETANVSASDILPRQWRVRVEAGTADSCTYSVGACVIV